MRTSPSLNTTRRRSLILTGMIIALVGLLIAFGQNNSSAASQPKASNQTNLGPVINKATTNSFSFNSLAANRLLGLGGMFTSSVSVEANPPAGTPVAVGQTITYVVTLTNDDITDTAVGAGLNLTVSALVPTGTALIPGSVIVLQQPQGGNTFACQAGTPSCTANKTSTISTFDNFATFKFQYKVTVTAAIGAVLNNTATYVNDGGPATVSSSTITHEVAAPADLGISKFANPSAVIAGGTSVPFGTPGSGAPAGGTSDIDYELLIANAGPNNATNVIIQDSLPNNTFVVSAPALATATVAVNGVPIPGFVMNCIFPGRFVECRPGDNSGLNAGWTNDVLPSGFSARMRYRVRVPGDVAQGTIIQNEARISSTPTNPGPGTLTADPNTGNNYSTPVNTLVNTLADLGITKVTSNPTPTAGGAAFSYTLTVTNQGPSDAQNVIVNDPLPPGIIFQNVSVTPAGAFTCAGPPVGTNGVVSCTSGVLFQGGGATITIVAQVVPNVASGVRTNTATVASDTQEPNPNVFPNAASIQQTIQVDALLAILKTGPATINAGELYTYKITLLNGGNSTALNVSIQDILPPNTTFDSLNATNDLFGKCSHDGLVPGTITCASVDVSSGTHDLNITLKLAPNAPTGPLPNTATITGAGTGTIIEPTSTTTATVRHKSDLEIEKTAQPNPVIAGTNLVYTIKVKNLGISDLAPGEVTVNDTTFPPAGTTLVGTISAPAGWTCASATTFPCTNTNASLPVGASVTFTFTVKVNSNFNDCLPGAFVTNTATVATVGVNVFDPNLSNNSSTVLTSVVCSADLGVAKTATAVVDPDVAGPLAPVALPIVGPNVPPGSVNAGGYIRYDVPFGNAGPSDAVRVVLTDVVPGNTAFVGALATGGAFVPATQPPLFPFTFTIQATDTDGIAPLGPNVNLTCTVAGAPGSQAITCTPFGNAMLVPSYPDGNLPAGYTGQLTFFVKVNESVQGGTIVANPANITSTPNGVTPGTADPNPGNNTSLPTQTVVIASSNLSISKIVQSAVTVGPNPNQTGPIGPATPANGAITTGTAVLPGTFLTYRVTVTNNGPSDVSNIRVTDVLPSGLETPPGRVLGVKYISVNPVLPSGATFTCAAPTGVNPSNNPQGNGGSLVCTAPLLSANAPNNVAAIDITVFIDPATKASLVNTATFDATLNNFNRPVSGSTTLTTPVAPTSDLVVVKTHAPDPVIAGTEFDYTITMTNNGPSAAQMVTLADIVPAFQQIKDIQITQVNDGNVKPAFSCTPAGDANVDNRPTPSSFTCKSTELPPNKRPDGTINPSGSVVFKIRVKQGSLSAGNPNQTVYQNCLTVTSMSFDPNRSGDGSIFPALPPDSTPDGAGLFENVSVCDNVNVIFRADLATTKTDSPDPVIAGTLLTYTVNVTNNGPSAALNLKITDPLPAGTVFWDIVNNGGATTVVTPAQNTNGVVTATWAGLTDVGVTRTLVFRVRVCSEVLCNTVITNTATGSSDTTDPNLANNDGVATTTVQAQSDLQLAKAGPASAPYSTTPVPSIITYTLTFQNNGPSNSAGTAIVDVLPKGFTLESWTSTVAGTTLSQSTVNGTTTLSFALGILGPVAGNPSGAIQCTTTFATGGTITIRARVPIKHPVINVTNTATISTTNCLADPNLANNTSSVTTFITMPGQTAQTSYPARTEVSDMQAGSILFYPIYTSDIVNPNKQNTRINMTNVSSTESVSVHIFAVDGSSCSVLDYFICLTPNQTWTYLASDFDPGNSGYIMAVAVEDQTGLPRAFNCLIGDEYVKFTSGHAANLGAEAIQSVMMFPGGVDPNQLTVDLKFDDMFYNRLPRVVAADNIPSVGDKNSTMLILNRVAGDFTSSAATIGNITGLVYDDQEIAYSYTRSIGSCQLREVLSNTFPRTFTPFSRVIPAGRSGWMKIYNAGTDEKALFGATINYNPDSQSNTGAFNQGHNLHTLTVTERQITVRIPVIIPTCN